MNRLYLLLFVKFSISSARGASSDLSINLNSWTKKMKCCKEDEMIISIESGEKQTLKDVFKWGSSPRATILGK
jgi:hypothetical protein